FLRFVDTLSESTRRFAHIHFCASCAVDCDGSKRSRESLGGWPVKSNSAIRARTERIVQPAGADQMGQSQIRQMTRRSALRLFMPRSDRAGRSTEAIRTRFPKTFLREHFPVPRGSSHQDA